MNRCEGKRRVPAGEAWPSRAASLVAFALLAVMTAGTPAWAQWGDSTEPPQPAVSLPPKDILNPEVAPGSAGNGNRSPVPEAEREIRRPTEDAGSEAARAAGQASPDDAGDKRELTRQGGGRGFWRASDFLPLAIVLGLVAVAAWVVKRYMPARRLMTGAGAMEIVARMPLSSRQSLVLVKMGRQMVLVGVSPERINPICLVDDPDQVADLMGRIASQTPNSATAGFRQSLDQQADAFVETDEEPVLQGTGGVRSLLEKVRRLSRNEIA